MNEEQLVFWNAEEDQIAELGLIIDNTPEFLIEIFSVDFFGQVYDTPHTISVTKDVDVADLNNARRLAVLVGYDNLNTRNVIRVSTWVEDIELCTVTRYLSISRSDVMVIHTLSDMEENGISLVILPPGS